MGSLIGWHCENCGAEEYLYYGAGKLSFNDSEMIELSQNGSFGSAMKLLFEYGIPDGWMVVRENAFYKCPNCNNIISGETLRIDDEGSGCLVYYIPPDACNSCGEELFFEDDNMPMSEHELTQQCEVYVEKGCPKCGSKNVSLRAGYWD